MIKLIVKTKSQKCVIEKKTINKTINNCYNILLFIIIIIIYASKRPISSSNTNIILKPFNKQCNIHRDKYNVYAKENSIM